VNIRIVKKGAKLGNTLARPHKDHVMHIYMS